MVKKETLSKYGRQFKYCLLIYKDDLKYICNYEKKVMIHCLSINILSDICLFVINFQICVCTIDTCVCVCLCRYTCKALKSFNFNQVEMPFLKD